MVREDGFQPRVPRRRGLAGTWLHHVAGLLSVVSRDRRARSLFKRCRIGDLGRPAGLEGFASIETLVSICEPPRRRPARPTYRRERRIYPAVLAFRLVLVPDPGIIRLARVVLRYAFQHEDPIASVRKPAGQNRSAEAAPDDDDIRPDHGLDPA